MKKNATFIVSNSFGETESIFPIILENYKQFKSTNLIFMNASHYNRYLHDHLFTKIKEITNINILVPKNKITKFLLFFKICLFSKYIFHSEDMLNIHNIILNFFSNLFFNKRILFKHTSSPWFKRNYSWKTRNFNRDKNKQFLLYDEGAINHFSKMGFNNITKINDYNISEKVNNLIASEFGALKKKKFILILSFKEHIIFSKNKRLTAYRNVLSSLNKHYPHHHIYIKPHPSESTSSLKDIIMRNYNKNLFITQQNTTILTKYADVTIALCTFGGFRAFAQNKKSAIYYEYIKDWMKFNHFYYNNFDPQNGDIPIIRNKNSLNKFLRSETNKCSCNYKSIKLEII